MGFSQCDVIGYFLSRIFPRADWGGGVCVSVPMCLSGYYFNDFILGKKSRERNLSLTTTGRNNTGSVFDVFI